MADFFSPRMLSFVFMGTLGAEFILIVLVGILLFRVRHMRKDASALFSGKKGADLEEIILAQKANIRELDSEIQELYDIAERLYRLGQESLHKTEILRFNPFKEVGGNQSFTIAFLNGKNSGFVISSLHTREGTRMYAKPVINGAEAKEYPLTAEEKQVVAAAAKKHSEVFTQHHKQS